MVGLAVLLSLRLTDSLAILGHELISDETMTVNSCLNIQYIDVQ